MTGNSQDFEHHSQRGTCLKGSRIEVELEESKMLACGQGLLVETKAACAGAAHHHVEDKLVKIIQVFQGLVSHVDHVGCRL